MRAEPPPIADAGALRRPRWTASCSGVWPRTRRSAGSRRGDGAPRELRFIRNEVSSAGSRAAGPHGRPNSLSFAPCPGSLWILAVVAAGALWLARPQPKPPVRRFRVRRREARRRHPHWLLPSSRRTEARSPMERTAGSGSRDLRSFRTPRGSGDAESHSAPFGPSTAAAWPMFSRKSSGGFPWPAGEATGDLFRPREGAARRRRLEPVRPNRLRRVARKPLRSRGGRRGGEADRRARSRGRRFPHAGLSSGRQRRSSSASTAPVTTGKIAVLPEGGAAKMVPRCPTSRSVAYSPTGYLLYAREIDNEGISGRSLLRIEVESGRPRPFR